MSARPGSCGHRAPPWPPGDVRPFPFEGSRWELDRRRRLDRRFAVRADLPSVSSGALQFTQAWRSGGADRAHEKAFLDVGSAHRAVQLSAREPLLHPLDLELAFPNVFEVFGRPEEHVDQRADNRNQAEDRCDLDQPGVLDTTASVLEDPVGEGDPKTTRKKIPRFRATTHASEPKKSLRPSKSFTVYLKAGAARRSSQRRKRARRSSAPTAAAKANTLSRSASFVIVRVLPAVFARGRSARDRASRLRGFLHRVDSRARGRAHGVALGFHSRKCRRGASRELGRGERARVRRLRGDHCGRKLREVGEHRIHVLVAENRATTTS